MTDTPRHHTRHGRWTAALAALLLLWSAPQTRANNPVAPAAPTLLSAATANPAGPDDLDAAVAALAQAAKVGDARVGIHIVDLATGDVLADHASTASNAAPNTAFIPASNMKLITTGAALHLLGPQHKFTTELRRDGSRLIIVGGGDPGFADPVLLREMTPQLSVNGFLDTLADHVAGAGFEVITEIVVDDRVFDRDYIHASWPRDQLNEPYCAQVNGLNFHLNTVTIFARPAPELGNPALITVEPATDAVHINAKVNTTGRAGTQSIWLTRALGTNNITAMGRVRVNGSARVTIHDSASLFAHLLADRLAKKGVKLADDVTIRLVKSDEDLAPGTLIVHIVTPIERALKRCNTDSQNLYAESMFKTIGAAIGGEAGSWTNAAAMTRMVVIERLGASAARSFVVADGSGLSRLNRVTPRFMTAWLASFARDETRGEVFIASLAKPGEGTLRSRFRTRPTNEVRAKTGFINGVRTMSGYVFHTVDGERVRTVAFSVLVNDLDDASSSEHNAARQLQDDVVGLIDQWVSEQSAVAHVPDGG